MQLAGSGPGSGQHELRGVAPQVWQGLVGGEVVTSCMSEAEGTGGQQQAGMALWGRSLALVITVRGAAFSGEPMAGAGPPESMHLGGLRVTAAGGADSEVGKGWPDLHTLDCDRALNGLPELGRDGNR